MGLAALAVSAQVERDDAMIRSESGQDPRVQPMALDASRKTVNQDDGGAMPALDVMDPDASGYEELVAKRLLGRGRERRGEGQRPRAEGADHEYAGRVHDTRRDPRAGPA